MLGCIGLAKDAAYLVFVYRREAPIRLGGWSVRLPTLRLTLLQVVVGLVDICLVASVLYLLLPASARIAFLPFLAVYLASVLVGVLSHVPAGLGVLESMLLLLLPHVPPEQLLAAVLIYRVIYEVIPFVIALALWGGYELTAARRRAASTAAAGARGSAAARALSRSAQQQAGRHARRSTAASVRARGRCRRQPRPAAPRTSRRRRRRRFPRPRCRATPSGCSTNA